MRLGCGRCVLRLWREGDEPSLVCHGNDYEGWRGSRDRFPQPYARADDEWWVAFAGRQDPQTHFAIEVDGETAGGVGLELKRHRALFRGDRLPTRRSPPGAGNRHGRRPLLDPIRVRGFDLTRIFAVPFADGHTLVRVLENCEYVCEGTMRRSALKEGVVLDQALYAITDRDLSRA